MTREIHINGLRLSYESDGPLTNALVFVHGNSSSSKVFQKFFKHISFASWGKIALDLPGHGQSDYDLKAANSLEIYSLAYYADVIVAFIQKLNIKNYILIGHSLGGHIITHAAERLSPRGIVLLQTPPLEVIDDVMKGYCMNNNSGLLFSRDVAEDAVELLLESLYSDPTLMPDFLVPDFMNTDGHCRFNVLQSLGATKFFGECSILKKLNLPLLISCCRHDSVVSFTYLEALSLPNLYKGSLLYLPGGHYPQLECFDDLVLPLNEFVRDCFISSSCDSK